MTYEMMYGLWACNESNNNEDSVKAIVQQDGNITINCKHEVINTSFEYYNEANSLLGLPKGSVTGLACVQAQAHACGCPVIATKNTGAEDLFTDGQEGFIVPIRDADAIADRLQMLADDPSLR